MCLVVSVFFSVALSAGCKHVKGILLFGPPGCGKTLMARQIGKMLNAREPKIVNGPEILNKYVGESEANIRKLFADAEEEQKRVGNTLTQLTHKVMSLTEVMLDLQFEEIWDPGALNFIPCVLFSLSCSLTLCVCLCVCGSWVLTVGCTLSFLMSWMPSVSSVVQEQAALESMTLLSISCYPKSTVWSNSTISSL